uniref:Peptidase S9 prolyl oligopeptidase catalytic domain-containing protein n=1 Tax=Eucampia antarctica TaxID=49252 RepID=A0A7S2RUE5_9STRA
MSSNAIPTVDGFSSRSNMKMSMVDAPYGAWKSPITSKAMTAGSVAIGSLKLDRDDNLFWIEGRPNEGGRYVVCQYSPENNDNDNKKRNERDAVDVTPAGSNVRTRVHEYGGAAVTFGNDGKTLFYSDFETQRVMKLDYDDNDNDNDEVVAITPDDENCRYRFADGFYEKSRLVMVREDHTNPAPKDVVNEIVSVDANNDNEKEISVLATGNDFYSNPRISPDGTKMAYVTWNHPNMPWDATELRVVSITTNNDDDETSSVTEAVDAQTSSHELLAGEDGDTSIMQPMWHPLTGDLYYISDESGYKNIYRASSKGDKTIVSSILPMEYDFGGSSPGWSLGQQGFQFSPDGRLIATISKNGSTRLIVANVMLVNDDDNDAFAASVQEYGTDDGLPMQFGGVVASKTNNDLFFIGGSPSTPSSVYKWNLDTKGDAIQLACSSSLSFPDDVISIPEQIEFDTTLGTAFGYYYAPKNGKYQCTTESAPPLLVKAHGGPTACASAAFSAGMQYWTSRGFAVLDVDYGGSTGYGRDFCRRLRGAWGIVDIDDVCAGAKHLVEKGLAHPDRLCIDGCSAGGYTTLGALAFKDVFTAGCSMFGVADLTALAGDTHKFESRYLDRLIGKYPEDEAIYKQRSPIESVDTLNCPILLLQGDEDKIVPPNQAEMMHEALVKKGIPSCIKIYEGEQHGFRKSENIEDCLDSELAFYGKVYNIPVPDAVTLNIENLE